MSTAEVAATRHRRVRRHAKVHHAIALPFIVLATLFWLYLRLAYAWGADARGWKLDMYRGSVLGLLAPLALIAWLLFVIWRDLADEGGSVRGVAATPRRFRRMRLAASGFRVAPRRVKVHVTVASVSGVGAYLALFSLLLYLYVRLNFRIV